jgi:hypothetical protein
MAAAYELHVTGKSIGREHGLLPIPVPDAVAQNRDALEAVILETTRRCAPLAGGLFVRWPGRSKAEVWSAHRTRPNQLIARFTLKEVQP